MTRSPIWFALIGLITIGYMKKSCTLGNALGLGTNENVARII
jgi:hypothetical protein